MTEQPEFLSQEDVLSIHQDQLKRYGGSPGVRDEGLLQSAVSMPMAGFGGEYLHKGLHEMAAAYLFHIVQNHPFVDGNKRTGAVSALAFLLLNGYELDAEESEFETMVREVASGKLDKQQVAEFFKK